MYLPLKPLGQIVTLVLAAVLVLVLFFSLSA